MTRRRLTGPSAIRKRSIVIAGHKTSISLEDEFWTALHDLARERETTLSAVAGKIDAARPANANLASAIRVAMFSHLQLKLDTATAAMSSTAGLLLAGSAG